MNHHRFIVGLAVSCSLYAAGCGSTPAAGPADAAVPTADLSATTDGPPAGSNPDLMAAASTGAPCTVAGDCAPGTGNSQPGICQKSTTSGNAMITWSMGYCTSACRLAKNDANDGTNPDCPGGSGTCTADVANSSTVGHCRALCNAGTDCRTTYACFFVNDVANGGCEPAAQSECDPNKAGTCGAGMPVDGGVSPAPACVSFGPDNAVGTCFPGCNPFAVTGCPNDPNNSDCHVSSLTGEGECDAQNMAPAATGAACMFDDDCAPGYGCLGGSCWKYCHDDGKTVAAQCGVMGATCVAMDMSPVKPSTVGICSTSK